MIFGLVLMCLDTDATNCKLFHVNHYTTEEACIAGLPDDIDVLEAGLPMASMSEAKCVRFAAGEAA